MLAGAYADCANGRAIRMNESHAQFFRELRELCDKHSCSIRYHSEMVQFCLYDDRGYPHYYSAYEFDAMTAKVKTYVLIPIDAAQKEGEE